MLSRLRNGAARVAEAVAGALDRAGVIDRSRLDETMGLAWPRIVTGFAIMSKNTVDLAVIGYAVGVSAVAGMGFAFAYWQLAKFVSIGLAGGTVSLVSQNYGGDERGRAGLVVKQSLIVAALLVAPIVAGYVLGAERLIALVGGDGAALSAGTTYLVVTAPALAFEFFNMIASRTYAGVGDTRTPMIARAGGALLNVVLTVWLVLGAGLGVFGAGLGTAVSIAAVGLVLAWGMTGRSYFGRGASPVPVGRSGPWFDAGLTRQLLRVSAPLIARRVAEGIVVFPLLWIASSFGQATVAALEVGRRVRALLGSFSWGFSIAASTLVGQRLGAGEETLATAYGRDVIALSAVVYVLASTAVILAARPIAGVFVDGPAAVSATAAFVVAAAISAVPLGVDGSITGSLRGAGDTRWPFVASMIGLYAFALPAALVGLATPLGVGGLYAALVAEKLVPAGLNGYRFRSNRWQAVSRRYRPGAGDAEEEAG
ncbi:MATE family efflux transporter [Halorubrum sp. SP3]|uniref:MATE family efflux transporter n=1 Tax=unclassified Halorubrum TaxID=2642239 RepID=UPI0010F5849B|nr:MULTISPECIES: MATE family efflux transporter [unclassified Halorubrum]TKX54387.1 MATE family efflux transporter [Halorubrum sp. SP3]TKX68400.1 MATE family efflux transporter [Halorubrum sp. SP9]